MSKHISLPKPTPWNLWIGLLVLLLIGGLAAGVLIFTQGLHLTNLTDMVPWGLWITIDLSSIALSAGAFTICAAVYLLGLKRFQAVARTACYIGLLGYSMAVLTLMLDIGRPDRFWHAVTYWNPHSLLWEVTMCVTLYLTVLLIEVLPILANLEWLRQRYPKLAEKMASAHHLAPVLAVFGLGLSMLHQSSLGAAYGVIKARPLWYRPDMSVLFIVSAIAGGMALTVFASMLSSRLTKKAKIDDVLLERVAYFIGWVLVFYLYFRFWDTLAMTYTYEPGRTEGLRMITHGAFAFNFWIGEMLLGIFIPMILLLNKTTRLNPFWRMVALLMVVGGVVAYRYDTNLSGQLIMLSYLPGQPSVMYTDYTPSLIEWVAGLGVIAYGLLAFSLGVRYLRVVDHTLVEEEHAEAPHKTPEQVPA
ncbi:MAG: NrfD/PsrC family molybdoenzyme membrane anchor subunit [Chloroflexota bacterium]